MILIDRVTDDELAEVAEHAKKRAERGTFNGVMDVKNAYYLDRCRHLHRKSGTQLIYTRDTGHHTSGWFKNPEFERCLHLSLSFFDPTSGLSAPRNGRLSARWARAFFGDDGKLAWVESPKSAHGRAMEVWHWRVFCDEHWQPIHPRGEVYSTELTEKGWKSASQVEEETGIEIFSTLEPG